MRFCFPKWIGPRHAGLGNELIPWAKAFIASRELGIRLLHPAWGLNDRKYYEYFGTSRFDWTWYYLLGKLLPTYTFTEEEYNQTGEKDFDKAVRAYADKMGLWNKKAYVLYTEGMWGSWYPIRKAKTFVWRELYGTRYLMPNLYRVQKEVADKPLVVAVHIRMGDFLPVTENKEEYQGLWNTRMPLEWYVRVCRSLKEGLGEGLNFLLLTDGKPEELREFLEEFRPITTFDHERSAISDLLAMANADALVCSISSYSMWGAFLSGEPYFWFLPNLRDTDGFMTLWGERGAEEDGLASAPYQPRGVPVGEDGKLPAYVIEYLRAKMHLGHVARDLVQSGGVPRKLVEGVKSTL